MLYNFLKVVTGLSDRCRGGDKAMHLEESPELISLLLEPNGPTTKLPLISWKPRTSSQKKYVLIAAVTSGST